MEKSFKSYRDLLVWQKAMSLAEKVYRETRNFPSDEKFGLISQMRRAAVSIPSNIAEGHSRFGPGEFQRGISIAMGSVAELETQVMLSANLGFFENTVAEELRSELSALGRMLRGLQRSRIDRRTAHGHYLAGTGQSKRGVPPTPGKAA